MLGWIIGIIAAAAVITTLDLLENNEIFDDDHETGADTGTGGAFPYEGIEALSMDIPVEFTKEDEARADMAICEIKGLLGKKPVKTLCEMEAEDRIAAAKELYRRLCTIFSLDIQLEFGEGCNGNCGCYCNCTKSMWLDYRYLLSDKAEYIRIFLDTVIHELRHGMQYHFIMDSAYNGVEEHYRRRMTANLHPSVYVPFQEKPELYYKQLCERDAAAYAARVMENLTGGEEE